MATPRGLRLIATFSAVLFLTATPLAQHVQAQSASIVIQNYSFQPSTMTVPVGTTVTWTNQDSVAHTSTSDTGVWDSGTLSPGMSFHYTFNTPGTFAYHCMIHPFMHGTIVVQGTSVQPQTALMVTVSPGVVMAGSTASVQGAGFTANNWAFVFWQRPDRTTNGVWVPTTSSGAFALVLGFSPAHGLGTEFVTAFDWGTRTWAPFTTVTVVPRSAPGPGQLLASPNPVANGGFTIISGQGFAPNSVVIVQWRRPDGTVAAVRVVANSAGSFSFQLFADPRHGCGTRTMVALDAATGVSSPPLVLGEIC